MTLEERLREMILEKPGTKQINIANELGISRSAVSEWFSGNTKNIDPKHGFDLAKYFGVNPEWLIIGTGEKHLRKLTLSSPIDAEIELLQSFRKLTAEQQTELIESTKSKAAKNEQIFNELKNKFQ